MKQENLRALQKQEAIKRLEILQQNYGLHENVLNEFKEDETIYYSENLGGAFAGVLYWLRNREEFLNAVKKIEEKSKIFVYHCILNHTQDGDLLTMLYISAYKDEWKMELEELGTTYINAYVCNLSDSSSSEFGGIQITGVNGGIVRLY